MEQVFASDYEDVYRVKDGVMFYVKKYNRVRDKKTGRYRCIKLEDRMKLKNYIKDKSYQNCCLKIASEDVHIDNGFWSGEYTLIQKGCLMVILLLNQLAHIFIGMKLKQLGMRLVEILSK